MINIISLTIYLLVWVIFSLNSDANEMISGEREHSPRIISFSGYDWIVGRSGERPRTPGPNYFSNSENNVWVDSRGRLHLKITMHNERWECAGISLRGAKSYGKFTFRVATEIAGLNKNVVAGLFLYRDDTNEVDIEFSKWGDPENMAGQYALQPADNEDKVHRFKLYEAGNKSTHVIDWRRDRITFSSHRGHGDVRAKRKLIEEWAYDGHGKPLPDRTKVMINLWLFQGRPPSDMKEAELIIDSFEAETY